MHKNIVDLKGAFLESLVLCIDLILVEWASVEFCNLFFSVSM